MPGRGPGRDQQPVVGRRLGAGVDLAAVEVDGGDLGAGAQVDVVVVVPVLLHDVRRLRRRVAEQDALGERRPLVGQVPLGGEHHDPALVAVLAELAGGVRGGDAPADDDDVHECPWVSAPAAIERTLARYARGGFRRHTPRAQSDPGAVGSDLAALLDVRGARALLVHHEREHEREHARGDQDPAEGLAGDVLVERAPRSTAPVSRIRPRTSRTMPRPIPMIHSFVRRRRCAASPPRVLRARPDSVHRRPDGPRALGPASPTTAGRSRRRACPRAWELRYPATAGRSWPRASRDAS